jgi:LytS/YehU family sensor histidine kinase
MGEPTCHGARQAPSQALAGARKSGVDSPITLVLPTLQPLVENAVTHGIAQTIESGEIRIEAERRGPDLQITITNPRDADSPGRKGTGIGLQNVHRRLLILHGDEAVVRVLPDDTRSVSSCLPAGRVRREGEAADA